MKSLLLRTLQVIASGIALLSLPLCGGQDHLFVLQVPFDFMAGTINFRSGATLSRPMLPLVPCWFAAREKGRQRSSSLTPLGRTKNR